MKSDIYEPREDSLLLKKHVKQYAHGKVLDMGTGSGIQALAAKENADKVVAADINEKAVEHVNSKGIDARVSDLFSNIDGKFDLIIFNPPYLPEQEGENGLALSGGKKGHELSIRFLKQAKKHLNENGKILLVASSLAGNIKELGKNLGYKIKCLETEKYFFEKISVYLLET